MLACALSRSMRSVEFRIPHGYFADVESWRIGPETRGKKVHLVPIPSSSADARRKKRAEIVRHYNVRGPFLFLHVNLLDNRSEFSAPLEVSLRKEGDDYVGGSLRRDRHREHHRLPQRGHRPQSRSSSASPGGA